MTDLSPNTEGARAVVEWEHVFADRRYSDELVGKMVRGNAEMFLTALRTPAISEEAVVAVARIKHAWEAGYCTGQDYRDDPPFAGLGKHNRQHGWELYACSLTDRNKVAFSTPVTKPDEKGAGDEQLGEALFFLSDKLRASGFLNDDANHAAYEKVVAVFNAKARAPGIREAVLEEMGKHRNWELSYEHFEEEEGAWQVHSVNGGVNDREWTLIGAGYTPTAALEAAIRALTTTGKDSGGATDAIS